MFCKEWKIERGGEGKHKKKYNYVMIFYTTRAYLLFDWWSRGKRTPKATTHLPFICTTLLFKEHACEEHMHATTPPSFPRCVKKIASLPN